MSTTRFSGIFLALAVVLAVSPAYGQREIHHVPPLIDPDGHDPDVYQPFLELDTFDPDYQFFAPAEFSEFGEGPRSANIGWFASYDRVYLWLTRPTDQRVAGPSPASQVSVEGADDKAGDFTWGNRYDIGYMTNEDHGWLASFWHIDGPNFFDRIEIERINVFEPLDETNNNPTLTIDLRGGGGGGGGGANLGRLGQPNRDQNDPVTGARDFRIENSVNMADLSSFELNKTFRVKPLHYGSIVEPFVGFRYMKFSDFYQRGLYEQYEVASGAPLGVGLPNPLPTTNISNYLTEDMTRINARFDNHMVGGQLGVRWFKRKDKWNLSGELRAFGVQNFQSLESSTELERTYYGGRGPGNAPLAVVFDQTRFGGNSTEFVFGTEVRAEAAYAVTRDVSLRVGMAFMELARGIGRGNDLAFNDQSVTIVGGTFGFTVNR